MPGTPRSARQAGSGRNPRGRGRAIEDVALQTLFDPEFYRQSTGLGRAASLRHYLSLGDAAGFDPSPYFSVAFYKRRYPDWAESGATTAARDFLHRLAAGEARQPHPLIDPAHYRASYPDLAALGSQAVLHFMTHGDGELRSPSAGFAADFYHRCYLGLQDRHAFRHYVLWGRDKGNLPVPIRRSAAQSAAAMAEAVRGLTRPVVLFSHDAQPAGVPILTLDLARGMIGSGWQPVFVLDRAGPLSDRFRDLGPVRIVAEGWDRAGLVAGLPRGTPVLVNTAAGAEFAREAAAQRCRCVVLIHEMAGYLAQQQLIAPLRAARDLGAEVIVSMPRMATALEPALGRLAALRPGIRLPPTRLNAFREARRRMKAAGPVFISAGHADHRKGFDLFLEAAGALAQARPGARFVWLGQLDDWAAGLARSAQKAGLDLTLPGFVDDALAWYRAADAYLLTSRQDPGPTTVIHAAAMGTPFVGYAADIGLIGLTEAIGRFVPPGDLAGFVSTALQVASQTTAPERRRMRRVVGAETRFDRYVAALLSRLAPAPDDAT